MFIWWDWTRVGRKGGHWGWAGLPDVSVVTPVTSSLHVVVVHPGMLSADGLSDTFQAVRSVFVALLEETRCAHELWMHNWNKHNVWFKKTLPAMIQTFWRLWNIWLVHAESLHSGRYLWAEQFGLRANSRFCQSLSFDAAKPEETTHILLMISYASGWVWLACDLIRLGLSHKDI